MASDLEKAVSNINDAATKANITTDFFTAVLDGNESQIVINPVSGKSCPSLKKQINDRFTSDSSQLNALVSQATSQADRAKSEADRASQISGLDTVEQAVGLAAIPYPDVWIPLSDSLRMLTGYGREVKVGDDVVARYATLTRNTAGTLMNKSGALVNAGVNEARFEKEGVLAEGKSSNLVPWSEPATAQSGLTAIGRVTASYTSDGKIIFTVSEVSSAQWGQVQVLGLDAQAAGVVYSGSVWLSASVAGEYRLNLTSRPFGGGAEVSIGGSDYVFLDETPRRVSISRATVGNEGQICVRVSWSNAGNVGDSVTFHRTQLEVSPYVTSYIPTSGAAVTRAADKLTIPRLNNDCAEWYSGPDPITPIVTADTIELVPPAGKLHLRNVRGFFTPLTPAQKAALK
ncbi:MAG: phage head spike fiber domain-containing protein [Aeromonadaceae bacterium]